MDGYLNRNTIVAGLIPDYNVTQLVLSAAWQSIRGPTTVDGSLVNHVSRLRSAAKVECANRPSPSPCRLSYCLFDLETDPCEEQDVSKLYPEIVQKLRTRLDSYRDKLVPQTAFVLDPEANPEKFNYTWSIWST